MNAKKKKETPLTKQYNSIKSQHLHRLLLFRMGDFFELFGKDAEQAAPVLDIALTRRNKKDENSDFMCGFPHHAMETPVNKLLKAGFSVAICDQVEDPKEAKGIVKREVVMMLSPGVVFNPDSLDAEKSHYILSFSDDQVCWFEPSTGKGFFQNFSGYDELNILIERIQPIEILYVDEEQRKQISYFHQVFSKYEGGQSKPQEIVLDFMERMQGKEALFSFLGWQEVTHESDVKLSKNFFNHLEIFESNEKGSAACLFESIKKTKTPGGTRLFKEWLLRPTRNQTLLESRFQKIENWREDYEYLKFFREKLVGVGDLERRVSRAGHSLGSPTDLLRLKRSLQSVLEAYSRQESSPQWTAQVLELVNLIESSIEEDFHAQWSSKGGYIKAGFHTEMDRLIKAATGSQEEITQLEERERQKTGIPSLKVRYNSVFGFYIEVTKVHTSKVPSHYMRKQTLTNAERYTTEELSKIEEMVLSAQTKRVSLERELFNEIKKTLKKSVATLKEMTDEVSREDIFSSWAFLSFEKGFSKPEMTQKMELKISESFHPVVVEESSDFITNDVSLEQGDCFLITGPNMAGKSTIMRQVALCAYLAQCGFFVPAKQAQLPLYDGLFTRIGASDLLSKGLSTFMVEMKETAEILENSTSESLLILDEIGRGTSSRDGMSLARSILEFLVENTKSHTFFATHYHELKELEVSGIKNVHMGYKKDKGEIRFLYKLLPGASEKSYGIEVASLAGISSVITQKAFKISQEVSSDPSPKQSLTSQLDFMSVLSDPKINEKESQIIEEMKNLNTNKMTPLEALNKIYKWQDSYL